MPPYTCLGKKQKWLLAHQTPSPTALIALKCPHQLLSSPSNALLNAHLPSTTLAYEQEASLGEEKVGDSCKIIVFKSGVYPESV